MPQLLKIIVFSYCYTVKGLFFYNNEKNRCFIVSLLFQQFIKLCFVRINASEVSVEITHFIVKHLDIWIDSKNNLNGLNYCINNTVLIKQIVKHDIFLDSIAEYGFFL